MSNFGNSAFYSSLRCGDLLGKQFNQAGIESQCQSFGKKLTYKEGAPFIEKGSLDVTESFRKAISEAIKKSGYSREQVVELIEIMTNQKISKHMLDQATSSKKEYRFPAEVLHAFCVITGSLEPFRVLLHAIGCEVVDPSEGKALRLARLLKEKERIEREIEKLKKEMEVEYASNA